MTGTEPTVIGNMQLQQMSLMGLIKCPEHVALALVVGLMANVTIVINTRLILYIMV
ncbi:hypothetical protein VoSk93_43790 [Vibrio owensii]